MHAQVSAFGFDVNELIATFPPPPAGYDLPGDMRVRPAEFPARGVPTAAADVVVTGHDPSERRAEFRPRRR